MHDRLAQVGLDTATLPCTAQLHLFRIILAVLIVIGVVTGVRGYGNSIFSKTELNLSETREQSILNRLPKYKDREPKPHYWFVAICLPTIGISTATNDWHAPEMIHGYGCAAMAVFPLTTIPRQTGNLHPCEPVK
jgi:hypothetical protein